MKKAQFLKFCKALADSTSVKDTISAFENKKGYAGRRTLERSCQAAAGFKEELPPKVIAERTGWSVKYVNKIRSWWEQEAATGTVIEQKPYEETQQRRLIGVALQKALEEHYSEIRSLIDYWCSDIITPEIFQVTLDYTGYILSENKRLFEGVREHLPFPPLWADYANWKIKRAEYVDTCKELRRQIRESWTINETEIAPSFEQPILRLISGVDEELRYKLFVVVGHDSSELSYQVLDVNGGLVLEGRKTEIRNFRLIEHEECSNETLPGEYQRIADGFLQRAISSQAKQLLLESRGLEIRICGFLQETLLRRDYIMGTCKFCPGQARLPR